LKSWILVQVLSLLCENVMLLSYENRVSNIVGSTTRSGFAHLTFDRQHCRAWRKKYQLAFLKKIFLIGRRTFWSPWWGAGSGSVSETKWKSFPDPHKRKSYFYPSCVRYKTWKRRWFILNDNCFYYFEFTTDKEPRGIIPLENIKVSCVSKDYCVFTLEHWPIS